MTTNIQPYRIHPRYKISVVSPSDEKIVSNNDPISQSTINPTFFSTLKTKNSLWPNVLWIALGAFIFIALVIVIVVPIAAAANKGDSITVSTVSTTTVSTICHTTEVTSTVTSGPLPAQCSGYTTITDDDTRSPNNNGPSSCDNTVFFSTAYWVRFVGTGGTLLATCPIDTYLCGTDYPGWYAGLHPSTAGDVTSGYVCYHYNADLCGASDLILITNCNGFYIYYLKEPSICDARYCTI